MDGFSKVLLLSVLLKSFQVKILFHDQLELIEGYQNDIINSYIIHLYQDVDLFLSYVHRRSCSILQRQAEEDPEITKKMKELIDSQIENASHDFDIIKQEGCEHGKEKVLNIDVDKILGLKGDSGVG